MITSMQRYVEDAAGEGMLVVQPRMGFSDPVRMREGVAAVASLDFPVVTTLTLDSFTRVRRHDLVRSALHKGETLNGYPIVDMDSNTTAEVLQAAGDHPVQVRHGSADPRQIFDTMGELGLSDTEGGPVSYCLPYSRSPLSQATRHWREASEKLADQARSAGRLAHIETFGGCMLGQLCPPSLLVALSVLEALFFEQCGISSVSMSLTQQTSPEQDAAALLALRCLAAEVLRPETRRHVVLYTYMGLFPTTHDGAVALGDRSIDIAHAGGADRVIVKTTAEAHRIPTVAENLAALRRAHWRSRQPMPVTPDDIGEVLQDARRIVEAVLGQHADAGRALVAGFSSGVVDVPFCLHPDNARNTTSWIEDDGRVRFAQAGRVPVAHGSRTSSAVTSTGLLSMLSRTSTSLDAQARAATRVAIVGGGPRGLAVLERLIARAGDRPLRVTLIDPHPQPGGRIWRPSQPDGLLMNTVSGEVTMFSGLADDGPARAGAGPSLAEWLTGEGRDNSSEYGDFASRATYADYLDFFKNAVLATAPSTVQAATLLDTCVDIVDGSTKTLRLGSGMELEVEAVVLATGHPAAAGRTAITHGPTWIAGDSAADMDLARIPAQARVGVLGMGLSFFDVASLLTVGRGGSFSAPAEDPMDLIYTPSGDEPVLLAGSRSGVPIPGRGVNQKTDGWSFEPTFVTGAWLDRLRGSGPWDFAIDIEPVFIAECQLVYSTITIRTAGGDEAAQAFVTLARDLVPGPDLPARVAALAGSWSEDAARRIDLGTLARPFDQVRFADQEDFAARLLAWVDHDLAAALRGNRRDPLKAALDVLRDTRQSMMDIVDHCGLTAESHRDYLHRYVPRASLLSAGPPARRLAEFRALVRAGVVLPMGPRSRFGRRDDGRLVGRSSIVEDGVEVDWVIDARIPPPDLAGERGTLLATLRDRGVIRGAENTQGSDPFVLGGIDIHPDSAEVISRSGQRAEGLFAIGIPTEGKRWFTQVGSGRPREWNSFHHDADRVARGLLAHPAARILELVAS